MWLNVNLSKDFFTRLFDQQRAVPCCQASPLPTAGNATGLTACWIPVACIPRLPSRGFKQESSRPQVIYWVKQVLLGAETKFDASNCVLVALQVPIHTVDLQQP